VITNYNIANEWGSSYVRHFISQIASKLQNLDCKTFD